MSVMTGFRPKKEKSIQIGSVQITSPEIELNANLDAESFPSFTYPNFQTCLNSQQCSVGPLINAFHEFRGIMSIMTF